MDVGCIVTIVNAWIALACTLGLTPGPKEGAAATRPSTGARPNVVVIMTDDQRADTLGCTGHRFIRTPNIDALARDGAIFQNSFAVTPRCCPSRATLLSGRYTHLTGVSTNGCDMCYDEIVLLPALLKERGYTTAFIGKWHMGGRADARPGFDHWVCYNDYKGQGVYFDASFNVNGKSQSVPEFSTDAVADFAVEWLGRTGDRPYFLLVCLKNPHAPCDPPPRHETLYEDVGIDLPRSWDDDPATLPQALSWFQSEAHSLPKDPEEALAPKSAGSLRETIRAYCRMIPSIDDAVGKISKAIEASGGLPRTLIIFTSDNGLMLGEHGLSNKGVAYEPSIRVPLIMRYPPAIRAGTQITHQVLNLDLAPTILQLAGAPVPAAMTGRSLVPLLQGKPLNWREDWLIIAPYQPRTQPAFIGVRTNEWKYVRYTVDRIEEQLFNLQRDPGERRNLAHEKFYARLRNEMQQRAQKLMRAEKVPHRWWRPFKSDPQPPGETKPGETKKE